MESKKKILLYNKPEGGKRAVFLQGGEGLFLRVQGKKGFPLPANQIDKGKGENPK